MEEKKVLERLQRQCARMEYCASDIRRKALKAMEGDAEAADRIVESLLQDRFVDDRRYAGAFAREKSALQGFRLSATLVAVAPFLIVTTFSINLATKHVQTIAHMKHGIRVNAVVACITTTCRIHPAFVVGLLT